MNRTELTITKIAHGLVLSDNRRIDSRASVKSQNWIAMAVVSRVHRAWSDVVRREE